MPDDVRKLLETALFDSDGETVEGAFVDHWVSNRSVALDALAARGFTDADRDVLLDLLRRNPPAGALADLLRTLRLDSLKRELLTSPSPSLRAAALMAGVDADIAAFARDPAPEVRIAAIDILKSGNLDDVDPAVRKHSVRFANADALARRYDIEPDAGVRRAILERGDARLLMRALDSDDAETRTVAARGLERVADAGEVLLKRLEVETNREATLALLRYQSYAGPRAFDVIAKKFHDRDAATRVAACWLFERFPADRVVPLLRESIGDPVVDRPVIMVLGRKADVSVLSRIVERLADPATRHYRREIENAIDGLTVYARSVTVPTDVARQIQSRIDALNGSWPIDVCKRENSLPLHQSSALYLWSLRPDGTVLESDLDTAMNNTEPVTDPLRRFVMILRGSRTYPELSALLDAPPSARVCGACLATGRSGEFDCGRCRGLGWTA